MKFPIFLVALALLVSLAKAQPVFEGDQELKDGMDQSISKNGVDEVYQDETLVAEPLELADAMEELNRQEQKDADVLTSEESHSRQKRAVCRCVRRGNRVVCVCRR